MQTRSGWIRYQLLLLLAVSAAATGCDEQLSAPAGIVEPRGVVAPRQMTIYSNAQKYSDKSKKPATGRSGTATLTVLALQAADGTTEVSVTAGAPGTLAKVQFKGFDPDGNALFTLNRTNVNNAQLTLDLGGSVRGSTLQVQANIRGVDGKRTDVVTVTETIKRRPDLAVSDVSAAENVLVGAPLVVTAVVRELNGDIGAWADCLLYVDGVAVDQASRIWVDASGMVSCAFQTVIESAGTHQLRVAAEAVVPGDWDNSNNTAEGAVAIVAADPRPADLSDFTYTAVARDYEEHRLLRVTETSHRLDTNQTREYERVENWDDVAQTANLSAFLRRAIVFPINIELAQETNGRTLHSLSLAGRQPDAAASGATKLRTWNCANEAEERTFQDDLGNVLIYYPFMFRFCVQISSNGSEITSFAYDRFAGDVTYRSRGFDRLFNENGDLAVDNSYQINTDLSATVAERVAYGDWYGFRVRITGANGAVHELVTTVDLLPFNDSLFGTLECQKWEWDFRPWDPSFGVGTMCQESTWSISGREGLKQGTPTR